MRGECGQYKVYITCVLKSIKYWLKLLREEEGKLLNSCYNMLFIGCENGKVNWASGIKHLLSVYGFYDIWLSQGTPNEKVFLYNLECRIRDCETQIWRAEITSSPKLNYYCMFKVSFEVEPYLLTNLPRKVKKQYAKFRMSNHNLQVEKGRHTNMPREDRLCAFCGIEANINRIECEFHMLFECILYSDLRRNLPNLSWDKTLFNFVKILSCKEEKHVNDLAWFIWKCFSTRTDQLDECM